ncbi:MAG: xanthine dehydrogenase family protein molybdopterin-binding subunit [Xanthobacteraceae bacterium]|nr:MAG: xanthine dehydrogenase family protein molybdopterin-binding subunit [Xanthobacteraceae bacterium]
MTASAFGVGQSVKRTEDDALLRGRGRYTSDDTRESLLHALVLRSPHAHARFRVDAGAARAMPGVMAVLTGEDVADLGALPCLFTLDGAIKAPPYAILAQGEVRHVGDAVAFVVARELSQARDALEAIEVEWQPLPAAIGAEAALGPGAPQVWASHPGNLVFETRLGDRAATDLAFAHAEETVEVRLVNQRLVTNFLETRAVVAEYDAARDHFTLTLGSQGSHRLRDILCRQVLKIPPESMRVVTPDVGGGFGTKLFPYREYALAAVAARKLGRPVKWVADRADHFLGDSQGRDNIMVASLALTGDGRFRALRGDLIADMGAYLSAFAPFIPYGGAAMWPGVYDIPVCDIRVRGVFTNTVPVDAYRGAGRPEAAYLIERLVDAAARKLDIAPDVIRRRNFISSNAMPYRTATGKVYDSGAFAAHLARAQEMIGWKEFPKRARAAKKAGLIRGIGLSCYVEVCGAMGPETATLRLDPDGGLTVLIGSQSTGQGHRTAYAQLVSEQFGVAPERVRVIQGDTALIASGMGTGGSSSIPIGGVSVARATHTLGERLKELAVDALEAGIADIEIAAGALRVAGTDRAISFTDLARRPGTDASRLQASERFMPDAGTYPNGTHIAEVEIDPATGATRIVDYAVVDDVGVTLNPLLLTGQIHGGAVQSLGQALMEQTVYDRDGQLVTGSLMDYALPRASDAPSFAFETRNVPCVNNPLGVKGVGEAGTIGATPAIVNAVIDALWREYRIGHVDMPATPQRIWTTIRDHQLRHRL